MLQVCVSYLLHAEVIDLFRRKKTPPPEARSDNCQRHGTVFGGVAGHPNKYNWEQKVVQNSR
jgi:hypothetical protein